MTPEEFENLCADYLQKTYQDTGCTFTPIGGSDSSSPDIIVKKNNKVLFSIETKEPQAQCGQFVVFPDYDNKSFFYSEANRPPEPSAASTAIIDKMTEDFEHCKTPSARELGFDTKLYYDRIVDYYKNYKNSLFFITREKTESGDFILFPTDRISSYFSVTACYRKKKSGSHNPNKREIADLNNLLPSTFVDHYQVEKDGKYTNVLMDLDIQEPFIRESSYRAMFRPIDRGKYRMTVLGTTENPNVIFTIKLFSAQDPQDIEVFLNELTKEDDE